MMNSCNKKYLSNIIVLVCLTLRKTWQPQEATDS